MLNKKLFRYKILMMGILAELEELYDDEYEEVELTTDDSEVISNIFNVYHAAQKVLNSYVNAEKNIEEELLIEFHDRASIIADYRMNNHNLSNALEVFLNQNTQKKIEKGWYLGKVENNRGSFFIYPFKIKLGNGLRAIARQNNNM